MSLSELSDKVLKEMEKLEVENMMTDNEKAGIILENLDQYIQVDWNLKKDYIRGIIDGIKEVRKHEVEI